MNMPGMLINSPVCYIRAKIPGQFDPLFFDIENVKNRFLISKVEIIQPPPPPIIEAYYMYLFQALTLPTSTIQNFYLIGDCGSRGRNTRRSRYRNGR